MYYLKNFQNTFAFSLSCQGMEDMIGIIENDENNRVCTEEKST